METAGLRPEAQVSASYMHYFAHHLTPSSGFFQSAHLVRVKILTYDFYVIRGAENIKPLFKNSWVCTSIPFVKFALKYAFGLPVAAVRLYNRDDSGGGSVLHLSSTIKARNCINYNVY